MTVKCDKCGRVYDDAQRWTICPHTPLGTPVQPYDHETNLMGYCFDCDQIGPHLCMGVRAKPRDH